MTKWIYDWHHELTSEEMNDLGEKGWELCGIHNGRYIFKMPKPKEKKVVREDAVTEGEITRIVAALNAAINGGYTTTSSITRKCITARLNEGKTRHDFNEVISYKVSEWFNDPEMKQYLRPETLFGNKFESYLQAAKLNRPKEPLNPNMKNMIM